MSKNRLNDTNLVAVTTIRYKTDESSDCTQTLDQVRSEAFILTARNLTINKIPCVAVFDQCSLSYLETLRGIGVRLVRQKGTTMGSTRREALRAAGNIHKSATHFAWLEPEKPNIVRYLPQLMKVMTRESSDLGLFNRSDKSMKSYGKLQAYYYLFCRSLATDLLGQDIDFAFGPMIVTRTGLREILSYDGKYGDRWDALFVPRLRMISQGRKVSILNVDFVNYAPMNMVEEGNPTIIEKRLSQLNNVVNVLIAEQNFPMSRNSFNLLGL